MGRERRHFLLLLLLLVLYSLDFFLPPGADGSGPSHGYNCSSDRSLYPCQSYASYLAGATPSLLDLASIGDLFGVSRLMIARATNLSSTAAVLFPGQPLLIPLSCSCISNRSYSPVDFQILAGDTFFEVSTKRFGNLTTFHAVQDVNPSLVPINLTIGVMVTFPLFCQCSKNRSQTIITYPLQPSDSYASVASRFGSDLQTLIDLNGIEGSVFKPYSTILVPIPHIPPPSIPVSSSDLPPPPPLSANGHGGRTVVGLAIALGVLGLLWVLLLLLISRLTKRCCWVREIDEEQRTNSKGQKWGKKMILREASKEQKVTMDVSEWLDKYKLYQIDELREATADFDQSCLIRGSVYRGKINGEIYAVKQMKWNAMDELKILQKVNHTNLVKLEGFCIDAEPRMCYLVYEYVPNGSLHSWLHDPSLSGRLDWRHRLRIAVDLANGLQYIHEHTWPRVVHKDIKSSNVLLDARLRAKIANFCLARTGNNAVTTHIVGTQGYVAPEYVAEGRVTTKMDVFSYGVVLLELVTGREAVSVEEGRALWAEAEDTLYADGAVKSGTLVGWMDGALTEQSSAVEGAVAVMNIARACLQRDPARRPGMVDVVYALAKADEASEYSGEGMSVVGAGNAIIAR